MFDEGQAERFREHGWLVVRGVASAARVTELERALDAVIPGASYPAWGDRVVEVAGISRASAELERHARDAAVARLAAAALGAGSVQLLQDTAFVKPASSGARVAWHQDYTYLGFLDRPSIVTARLALTPCTIESGCLRVIDGSHTWGLPARDLSLRAAEVEDALAALPPARRADARRAERVIELEPGDLSLHHCLLFHGSGENRSPSARKTLAVRLMDAECRLDRARLPSHDAEAHFPTDPRGRLTGASFPVVWSARERDP